MKTTDVLSVMRPETVVNIYQVPIERFGKSGAEVCRQVGEITTLLSSGQNYLEFDVVRIEHRAGLMTIVCKADAAQEAATVAAFCGTEESLDIRDLIQDEVEYRKIDASVIDKAIRYIKNSDRLLQLLDLVVDKAISSCQ